MNSVDPVGPVAYESGEAKPMYSLATLPPAAHFPRPLPAIWPGLGVTNEVKKPTQFTIGLVTITERKSPVKGRTFHEMRYTDRATGKEVRRRVSGLDADEIREMADNLTRKDPSRD